MTLTEDQKREKVLFIAKSQIGISESPPNSNKVKYNTWIYGKETFGAAYAWCGAFVSWCLNEAGFPLGRIDLLKGFVGCPYAVANIHKWGKEVWPKEAKPGDVVFFDWQLDGKFDHTGILESHNADGKAFTSIEGNTAVGNDSNGGSVMRRERSYKFAKFVRPNCYNT